DGIRDKLVTGVQTCALPIYPAHVPSYASLLQSTHSLVWRTDLISMASTCSQPITHGYLHGSIVKSGFQFSKSPPSDALIFGCARSEERRVGKECGCWLGM